MNPPSISDLVNNWILRWEFAVLYLATVPIAASVVIRFLDRIDAKSKPVAKDRSVVATLTMTLFFFGIYHLAYLGIGRCALSERAELAAKIAGSVLVVGGSIINVAARRVIGRFWSDQIEVQTGHTVVRAWPYSWCRHPMYGSLVVFGVGMGVLALNPFVAAAVPLVFLPAMIHRARLEERRLVEACGDDYTAFQAAVPMILPHFPETVARPVRGGLGMMQLAGILSHDLDLFLLSAVLTLGLSFVMARPDFRKAYKMKCLMILTLSGLAFWNPALFPLLWIPVLASFMSLSGHCPGTLLIRALGKENARG